MNQEIYEHYLSRVFAYVGYRVGNQRDIEDLVSEIFMSIFQNERIHGEQHNPSLDAWVFTIARNKVIDFYRKKGRNPGFIPLDELPMISSDHRTPEDQILAQERFRTLHQLISELPGRQQEIITLRFFGQLKNKEIATMLGIEERTVSAYLSRAIKALETNFEKSGRIDKLTDEDNDERS